ncbi:MAG: MCE family protein, partial [Campylobacterales bacterium]|nr:MCE family protein [Campylobacterales bacterium]
MRVETKVGFFVFIAIVFMFLMTTQVKEFSMFSKNGYFIDTILEDVTGLEKNSKVRIN